MLLLLCDLPELGFSVVDLGVEDFGVVDQILEVKVLWDNPLEEGATVDVEADVHLEEVEIVEANELVLFVTLAECLECLVDIPADKDHVLEKFGVRVLFKFFGELVFLHRFKYLLFNFICIDRRLYIQVFII